MEMKIKLDLSIGENENKKDLSLTYEEAKELYIKLNELFCRPKIINGFNEKDTLEPTLSNFWCKIF